MHLKEVFNAIYANHLYEYLVIDRSYTIIEHSDRVFHFCIDETSKDVFAQVPELIGLESLLEEIFRAEKDSFTIANVFKEPNEYVNVHIRPGRKEANASGYESVIVLFEIITEKAHVQQHLIQERNEKSLLLKKLSIQNKQLERLNKEMEKRVEEATRKYIEKSRMLELQSRHSQMGEMIGMITHQWKQPIGAMILLIHVLKTKIQRNELDPKELLAKLSQIQGLVDHMNDTIHLFQNFFNPKQHAVRFNLLESIEQIVRLVEYDYRLNNIEIVIQGDRSIEVTGYPNEFNQVILSILKNAKDAFLAKPHEQMHIEINVEKKDKHTLIVIRDNAGGIPEEIIDTIFEPYITTKPNGSGIGLNIAKTIIEQKFYGTITVRNVKDGAEFIIKL